MAEIPDLQQPILPDLADKQQRDCKGCGQLSWEVLTASLDPSLCQRQQQAREANQPSMLAGYHHESWIVLLEQHVLSGTQHRTYENTAGNSSEDWDLSDPVKHTVLRLCDYTEPSTPTLAEPMLQVAQPHGTLMSELLVASSEPQVPDCMPVSCARRNTLGSCKATYWSLVGQDLELQDTVSTLPIVLFDDSPSSCCGMDEAESREDTWQQCMADCHIRRLRTGHLKLYMDWSLSDHSASSSKTLQGYKRLLNQTNCPSTLPPVDAESTMDESHSPPFVAHSIAGAVNTPPGVPYNAMRQPEQLPGAVRARLHDQTQQAKHAKQAQHAQGSDLLQGSQMGKGIVSKQSSSQPTANLTATKPAPDVKPKLPCGTVFRSAQPARQHEPSADKSNPQKMQPTGVFQKRRSNPRARASARQQIESAGNDMAFFLGLQQGPVPAQAASKGTQSGAPALASAAEAAPGSIPTAGKPEVLDLCTDDALQDEEEDTMIMNLPDVQYSILCLPERHQGLLQRMKEEHSVVLRHDAGVSAKVSEVTLSTVRAINVCECVHISMHACAEFGPQPYTSG